MPYGYSTDFTFNDDAFTPGQDLLNPTTPKLEDGASSANATPTPKPIGITPLPAPVSKEVLPATTTPITAPIQAAAIPTSYAAPSAPDKAKQLVADFITTSGLTANQKDPSSLFKIVEHLRANNINAQVDATDSNGHTGGILVDGKPYQLIDGSNNWTSLQPWEQSGGQGGYLNYGVGLDDPATAQLMALISQRIAGLSAPVTDPAMTQFADLLKAQMGRLATPLAVPTETQNFQDLLKQEMAKLQAPVFSDEQRGNMRTAAFDQLNRQEQAEIENTVRQLASRGVPPDSGIVEHAVQQVRQKYITAKAQQQQQLNTYELNTVDDRRKQLLTAGQTGSTLALTQQQQQEQRQAQITALAQQLVEMSRAARGETNANADKAISLAALPVDITERRIAAAGNLAAGQASSPSSILSTLTSILSNGNTQANTNSTNNAAYIQALMASLNQIDWSKVFG